MFPTASYKARWVRANSLETGSIEGLGKFVYGQYGEAVQDVFVPYYQWLGEPGLVVSPHFAYANASPDVHGLVEFTERWGTLRPTKKEPLVERLVGKPCDEAGEDWFAISVETWLEEQQRFKRAMSAFERGRTRRELLDGWPYRTLYHPGLIHGNFVIELDFGHQIRELAKMWNKLPKEAEKTARQLGLFLPRRDKQDYQFRLIPISLTDALWLMLGFEAARGAKYSICPGCLTQFFRRRDDHKYCEHECAQRAASLRYYYKTGKEKRQMERAKLKRTARSRAKRAGKGGRGRR